MKRLVFGLAAFLALCVGLVYFDGPNALAQSGGGFPSRPRFQSVTLTQGTPSSVATMPHLNNYGLIIGNGNSGVWTDSMFPSSTITSLNFNDMYFCSNISGAGQSTCLDIGNLGDSYLFTNPNVDGSFTVQAWGNHSVGTDVATGFVGVSSDQASTSGNAGYQAGIGCVNQNGTILLGGGAGYFSGVTGAPSAPGCIVGIVGGAGSTPNYFGFVTRNTWRGYIDNAGNWQIGNATASAVVNIKTDTAADAQANASQILTLASGGNITTAPTISSNTIETAINCTTACSLSGMTVGMTASIAKGTTTNRASTTSTALDPDLQFTNVPLGTYLVTGAISETSGAGGLISTPVAVGTALLNVTSEESGVQVCGSTTIPTTGAVGNGNSFVTGFNCPAANAAIMASFTGNLVVTTAGSLGFSWAQNVSNAANTTINAGSVITLRRVN